MNARLDAATTELLLTAMLEMVDSIQSLCDRSQEGASPLTPDQFDRLALLMGTMLSNAERLCTSARRIEARSGSRRLVPDESYADLSQALEDTRRLSKVLLERFRPALPGHEQAIQAIDLISSAARGP